ncbi:MAG: MFS transporter [Phycisphaerae bacterium]|nr:MFS transporter [Phycisphaerae bacterium]
MTTEQAGNERTTGRPRLGGGIALLIGVAFGVGLGGGAVITYLPLYARSLGLGVKEWSALYMVYIVLFGLTPLLLAWVVDRYGSRPVILGTYALIAAAFGCFSQSSKSLLVLGVVLAGVGTAGSHLAIVTALQRLGAGQLGRVNGLHMAVMGLAGIISPLIASQVLRVSNYATYWYVCGAIVLVVLVVATKTPNVSSAEERRTDDGWFGGYKEVLRIRGMPWIFLGGVLLEPFSFQLIGMYGSLRLAALGMSDIDIGYVASVGAAAYIATALAGSVFIDRLSIRWLFAAALVAGGIACVGIGLSNAAWMCVISFIAYRICYGSIHPAWYVRISHLVPSGRLATAVAAVNSTTSFAAAGVGVLAAGAITIMGMGPLMAAGGIIAAAGGALTAKCKERSPATDG